MTLEGELHTFWLDPSSTNSSMQPLALPAAVPQLKPPAIEDDAILSSSRTVKAGARRSLL